MNKFLQNIAQYIYSNYSTELHTCCIVFPNRRPALFLQKYLSELIEKPIWSPRISTINDFFLNHSTLQQCDEISLIFELYNVYKKHLKIADGFDKFYFWGQVLLNDFNNVDNYLLNATDLFKNLASVKEIDNTFDYLTEEEIQIIKSFWQSFKARKSEDLRDNFITIWNSLNNIYNDFKTQLDKKNIAYEGMIYRHVAETLLTNPETINFSYNHYLFIGFNVFTRCEETIFEHLKKNNKAEFFWDYDDYYINNPYHEAGNHIRKNLKRFPMPPNFETQHNNFSFSKNIHFVSVPNNTGQTQIVSNYLTEWQIQNSDLSNTVIVPCDYQLLIPLLHSIPSSISEINITMGYPLFHTPSYSLLFHLITLYKNAKKNKENNIEFYYANVINLLNHEYINILLPNAAQLIDEYVKLNKIYLSGNDFIDNELLKYIFVENNTIEEFYTTVNKLLNTLYFEFNKKNEKATNLANIYLYETQLIINRLTTVIISNNIDISLNAYFNLLLQILKIARLPFEGEPIEGLQIMGILETRSLDFNNVIMLSVNEKIFPPTTLTTSFIPYNLRKSFGLPTFELNDSMYAYHFYRLLQRANNILLTYNNSEESNNSGEMSRFLTQLKFESKLSIIEKNVSFPIKQHTSIAIEITKDKEIQKKLNQFIHPSYNYFSPSAINTYIACPLQFYYRYIAELEKYNEMLEEIDPTTLGNIFHNAIKQIYSEYINIEITKNIINELIKDSKTIDQIILNAIKQEYLPSLSEHVQPSLKGRNIIIQKVLNKLILQLLENDKQYAPFTIVALEKKYTLPLKIKNNHTEFTINIGGKIDRIDLKNNTYRILDYKTGKVKLTFESIKKLMQHNSEETNNMVLQLFIYCMIFQETENINKTVMPAIYSIRNFFDTDFYWQIQLKKGKKENTVINDIKPYITELKSELTELINNLFDINIPFTQTKTTKTCTNCDYKSICQR